MQRHVIGKGIEPINIDKGRMAQQFLKPKIIRLNVLLFGVEIKET
jgi:hypothetical protein